MEFPLEFHDSHYGNEMRMVVKREGAPGMDGMPQTQASSLTHHPHLIQGNQVLLTQNLLGVSLPPSSTADDLVLPAAASLSRQRAPPVCSPQHTRKIVQKHKPDHIIPCIKSFKSSLWPPGLNATFL